MSEQTTRTPAGEQDFAGTPQPDAMLPVLDQGQLRTLRQVGRERDQTLAGPRVWRQALPVDPALGEDPEAGEFRPARFTRLVPVGGATATFRRSRPPARPRPRSGQRPGSPSE